ncbi:MAG: Mpo1-like protein, partial [Bacteroidota bacterium]
FAHPGTLLILFGLIFYLRLSPGMFLGMLPVSLLVLLGNHYLREADIAPLWAISLTIFAVAWVGQFIGHKIEGAKPSFLQDLQFLLIGPAWLLGFIYRKLGLRY